MMKKKITKKQIKETLKSENRTEIFKLFKKTHPELKVEENRHKLMDWIEENAPTMKVYKKAYDLAYDSKKHNGLGAYKGKHGIYEKLKKQEIVDFFKDQLEGKHGRYTKVPMVWQGWLWAVSPYYGLADYNKSRMIKVAGNENFVNKIMQYSKAKSVN